MEKQTGRSQKKEKDGGWKRRRRRGRREGEERKKKSWEEKKRTEKIPRMSSDFPAKPLWGGWRDLPGSSTLYCRTVCFYRTTLQKIPCSPSLISLSHSPHSLRFYPVFHLHYSSWVPLLFAISMLNCLRHQSRTFRSTTDIADPITVVHCASIQYRTLSALFLRPGSHVLVVWSVSEYFWNSPHSRMPRLIEDLHGTLQKATTTTEY